MKEIKSDHKTWASVCILSTVSVLTAYYLMVALTNLSALYFAYDFDIPAFFNLEGLYFGIPENDPLWTFDAAVTILLSRPITALLIGFLAFLLSLRIKNKQTTTLLVTLWINMLGIYIALGLFIDDALLQTGVYKLTALMHINLFFVVLFGALAIYFMVIIGIMNSRLIELSFPENMLLSRKIKLVLFVFVIPWILLMCISLLLKQEASLMGEGIKSCSLVIMLLPLAWVKKPDQALSRITTLKPVSIRDFIIGIFLILLCMALIIVMRQGVSITS